MRPTTNNSEHGQATIALVGVIGLALATAVVISVFAEAVVHRAHARNAADAVALAGAQNPAAGDALREWYDRHDVSVRVEGAQAHARSGPSQAVAWAATQPSVSQPAPALVAIIARAEQILDTDFASTRLDATRLTLAAREANLLRSVAADFGLCEQVPLPETDGIVVFELC